MGCGTALPSLALFQWQLLGKTGTEGLVLGVADYNPTVLQLVTLPNLILSWALCERGSDWEDEGELEITAELLQTFHERLHSSNISLHFFSGGWSPEFVQNIAKEMPGQDGALVLAAETIYSPAALKFFADALMDILDEKSSALVAAKKVYFGVGGSMEDFCQAVRLKNGSAVEIREESDGVRRAVVEVKASP
jgi:protein-histidine N-methyltransferase